jgi:phosphohistidine phosphatase
MAATPGQRWPRFRWFGVAMLTAAAVRNYPDFPEGSRRWDERVYLADSDTLVALLQQLDGDPKAVLLAGHNPGLQELIFDLVADENENALSDVAAEKYPTATFAVLELAIDSWADCAPGCGTLVHLTRPRDLDPALGPEKVR